MLACAPAVALMSCERSSPAAFAVRRIAIVGPGPKDGEWEAVVAGAQREAKSLAGTIVTYTGPEHPGDAEAQKQLLGAALAENPKALLVAPVDRGAMTAALAAARSAGVPVFVLGVEPAPADGAVGAVVSNWGAAGAEAAGYLATIIEKGSSVLLVRGSPTDDGALANENAFAKQAVERGLTVIDRSVYAGEGGQSAREKIDAALTGANVAGVYCSTLAGSRAAREILKARQSEARLIGTGADIVMIQALASSDCEALLVSDAVGMGRTAVRAAIEHLSNQRPPPRIDVPVVLATRKNMYDPPVKAVLMPDVTGMP